MKKEYIVIEKTEDGIILERFETLIEAVKYAVAANNVCEIVKAVNYTISVDEYK